MNLAQREASRALGEPINLYLFKGADPTLESLLRSVTIIPGTTEFGYGTTKVTKGVERTNHVAHLPVTDFVAALDELTAAATDLDHVSLVVAWHGTDLRCGQCQIRPKVEYATATTTPYDWRVGPTTRGDAQVVSQISGKPAVGGAPADRTVWEALTEIKARGLRVTLYPFILMDIPAGNALPNPYGGTGQPAYPWRGRITCDPAPGVSGTVDKTAAAATQVSAFFGPSVPAYFSWDGVAKAINYSGPVDDWGYRRFVLHLATIAAQVGIDDFLIASELVGLTTVRSEPGYFPAVDRLTQLAADVSTILGSGTRVSYAADWSEYHSYRPADGTNDVFFHLDSLWASPDIDFVGIDNYLPASDWRDGDLHLDRVAGHLSGHERRYLQTNIEGGEYYDWFYADQAARDAQTRTPIIDGTAAAEPWVFRNKDLRNWWANAHYNRPAGVRSATPTAWAAQSKPIVFTEIGCPAINKGANQPNVFVDAKSSESEVPHYSSGIRDDAMQRAYLEAWLDYWRPEAGNNPVSGVYGDLMIEWKTMTVWSWDARPYPTFPQQSGFWGDAGNWATGHWINGRIYAGRDFDSGLLGPYAYTDAETIIVRDGVSYLPVPIDRGAINSSGTLDKAMLEVTMAQGLDLGDLFLSYPPAQVVNLFIFQGHVGDDPDDPTAFPVVWTGRVLGAQHPPNETKYTCEPISTAIRRPGLRRNYQLGCPHVLYGSQCRANRKRATILSTVSDIPGSTRVTLPTGWDSVHPAAKYLGGMMGWTKSDGAAELRTILRIEGTTLVLSGPVTGLAEGDEVSVILGCNHQMTDCTNVHDNIHNYGGQPFIPLTNPVGAINVFY